MKVVRSEKFDKEFQKLPQEIRKKFGEKLKFYEENPLHPSLRVKKVQGTKNVWEFSITMKFRTTFQKIEGGVLFRRVGDHEILLSP